MESNALGKIRLLNTNFGVEHKLLENNLDSIVVGPINDAWLDMLKQ